MAHGKHAASAVLAPRSRFYQGPFGRICNDLEPWHPPQFDPHKNAQAMELFFLDIANNEMIEEPGLTPEAIAADPAKIADLEAQFSSNIPAGYTYFGQFVDHDITFDPASSLMRQNDPAGLHNHRTPRLDLDNIYGRGPDDSPYLYDREDTNLDNKPDKMLIGKIEGTNFPDLPRNNQGRALIGDMRNDENSMVSQLQLAFLMAHNTLAERARQAGIKDTFEAARRSLRWLYQWIVWNDFVKRIAIDEVYKAALSKSQTHDGRHRWDLGMKDVYNWKHQPFMPIEFSVAAYRFGHSMVRNSYQTNHPHRGFGNFAPIFDRSGTSDSSTREDLSGFRPMQLKNTLQWDWFLDMTSSSGPFPQRARKIDTRLANALSFLRETSAQNDPMNVLGFRNLLRGVRMELPSGTAVAKKWCLNPITIDPDHDSLWFYILKEADSLPGANKGQMLGRVGSTIVCATFAGLIKGDPNSWVNIEPCWTPDDDPLLDKSADNVDHVKNGQDWTLATIIRLSGLPVDANDFNDFT